MTEQPDPASYPPRPEFDLAALVARAQQADPEAFEILARHYSPVVLAYFYGRLPSSMDADDLLQEVLLTAFRNLSALRDVERFGPWLLRIAKSRYIDGMRAHRRLSAREVAAARLEEIDRASASPEQVVDHALQEAIRTAVGKLPSKYRVVVALRLFDELSLLEIADRLGLKESTVRMRHRRGLDMLRKSLHRMGFGS